MVFAFEPDISCGIGDCHISMHKTEGFSDNEIPTIAYQRFLIINNITTIAELRDEIIDIGQLCALRFL